MRLWAKIPKPLKSFRINIVSPEVGSRLKKDPNVKHNLYFTYSSRYS